MLKKCAVECSFFKKMQKKVKNIWSYKKKAVFLHDFSRFMGSYEPILRVYKFDLWGDYGYENEFKLYTKMSKICQITGKKAMMGCNVSHSKRHTKRSFDVNLFHKKFYWVEQDCWISLNVSAAGLRTINKIGLDAALKQAAEKGYLYE